MKSSLYEHYRQKYKVGGKTPTRKTGMWYRDGDVIVPSNQITMKGPQGQLDYFDFPIMGTGMQSGQTQVMQPGGEYSFPNDNSVYERKMQNGGGLNKYQVGGIQLEGFTPSGDVNYSSSASAGPLNFKVSSGTNVVTRKQKELFPKVGLDLENFNVLYDPESLNVGLRGSKGYLDATRDLETKNTNINAGLNYKKFNIDANAFLEKDKLANIGASARYQVNPNLAFTGDINYTPGQGSPNYNVGFKYSKSFQAGGMSIPGVNGSIVASLPDSPKESIRKAYMKKGGQHGGLDRWFAEKWVDVKSGKPCGRQEGENRAYPACRPSKRVNSKTPKTSSELSSSEKSKFKSSKTSSQRISYNHKRK